MLHQDVTCAVGDERDGSGLSCRMVVLAFVVTSEIGDDDGVWSETLGDIGRTPPVPWSPT